MKCNCCDNRIWVEPNFYPSQQVEIFTKKGDIETGVCLSVEEAILLIANIQEEINRVCQETKEQE